MSAARIVSVNQAEELLKKAAEIDKKIDHKP